MRHDTNSDNTSPTSSEEYYKAYMQLSIIPTIRMVERLYCYGQHYSLEEKIL